MQFVTRKRRQPPAIIIVSLIDVLIVVLIFMMATTTFKQQQPAVKLALPQSNQAREGGSEKPPVLVFIKPQEPFYMIGNRAVTLEKLQEELNTASGRDPSAALFIKADKEAPFKAIIAVMDAAKAAKFKQVNAYTDKSGGK